MAIYLMASEYTLQLIAFLKILWLGLFGLLYGLGGIRNKWLRRFVGSGFLTSGIIVFSQKFSWWYLLYFGFLACSLSLGYGAKTFWRKVRRRTVYGLALGISALPLAILNSAWILFVMHIILCISTSVILGVFNPCKSAREEETLIAVFAGVLPLFMV